MPGPTFPRGRKLFFGLALIALIIGAWTSWPASDPMIGTRRFSDWVNFADALYPRRGEGRLEELRAITPAEIKWLADTVEHGRHPFVKSGPLPFDGAPDWLRQYLPEKWGGLRPGAVNDERVTAGLLLCWLGADAAPAIPSLVKALEFDDDEAVRAAAMALQAIGLAAWPEIQKGLKHPSVRARYYLISHFYTRIFELDTIAPPLSDAELKRFAEALGNACHDPNNIVRDQALEMIFLTLGETADERISLHLQATIPDVVSQGGGSRIEDMLSLFRRRGASMLPVYTGVLEGDAPALYRFVAEEMHQMGPTTWPVVERLLGEGKPEVRYALVESISRRLKPDYRERVPDGESARVCAALIDALGDADPQLRALAAETISWEVYYPENHPLFAATIPHLIALLAGPDFPVRSAQGLREKYKLPDSSVKMMAMEALKKFGGTAVSAVPQLIALLNDEEPDLRGGAASTLGAVDREEKRSADRLRKMLDDSDAGCRMNATFALEDLGLKPEE
jgi:HEAT repeat protein